MPSRSIAFMGGVPELLILRVLSEKEMYGYEIAKAVQSTTADALALGEGVLYPALHALLGAGALKAHAVTVVGRKRIYYSLTPQGRRRLATLTKRWRAVSGAVNTVLGGAYG